MRGVSVFVAGLALAGCWLLAGCGEKIPEVTPELVTAAQTRWPTAQVTSESLRRGRDILTIHCATCHRAPAPSQHTDDEWAYYLHEMSPRAQLTQNQTDELRIFLLSARTP